MIKLKLHILNLACLHDKLSCILLLHMMLSMNGVQLDKATGTQKTTRTKSFLAINLDKSFVQTINLTPKLGKEYKLPSKHIHPHFTGNDKGLYATMIGGRIDPSSCLVSLYSTNLPIPISMQVLFLFGVHHAQSPLHPHR